MVRFVRESDSLLRKRLTMRRDHSLHVPSCHSRVAHEDQVAYMYRHSRYENRHVQASSLPYCRTVLWTYRNESLEFYLYINIYSFSACRLYIVGHKLTLDLEFEHFEGIILEPYPDCNTKAMALQILFEYVLRFKAICMDWLRLRMAGLRKQDWTFLRGWVLQYVPSSIQDLTEQRSAIENWSRRTQLGASTDPGNRHNIAIVRTEPAPHCNMCWHTFQDIKPWVPSVSMYPLRRQI